MTAGLRAAGLGPERVPRGVVGEVGGPLRLGADAEVLGPAELRAAVAEAVGTLARRHGRDAAAGA